MSFLNAFQGYYQIALAPKDQEKTSFIFPEGNYYYTVMLFELKNAGATYQRMVTRMFREGEFKLGPRFPHFRSLSRLQEVLPL